MRSEAESRFVVLRAAKALGAVIVAGLVVAVGMSSGATDRRASGPSVREMIGQLVLARMHGMHPTAAFLARIRRGEIGGVVLFDSNFGPSGPKRLIAALQATARAGGQPPLLIGVDQEGGIVKRLPGAPSLSPPQMANATIAEAQGLATARNLTANGINLDFAPVLDVNHGGFIAPRTFGTTPAEVAERGPAFALGLARGHVLASAKHFPGLGYASLNTDNSVATVSASAAALRADWLPYKTAIRDDVPLVMISTAVYPSLGSTLPAALSRVVVGDLRRLGFRGVIVTDALRTPAVSRFMSPSTAAVAAVEAGVDLALAAGPTDSLADTDGASTGAYNALIAAAKDGRLTRIVISRAYRQVERLKSTIG